MWKYWGKMGTEIEEWNVMQMSCKNFLLENKNITVDNFFTLALQWDLESNHSKPKNI